MAAIYTDGDFNVASAASAKRFSMPFLERGDRNTIVYEQDFMQSLTYFEPLELDTPDTFLLNGKLQTTYLVGESSVEDLGGNIGKWTRTFASIPPPRVEWETFSWTKPGLGAGAIYSPAGITSVTVTSGQHVITANGHGMVAGDFCVIKYTALLSNGTQVGRQVFREVLAVTGADITVALIQEPATISAWIQVQKVDRARDPVAEVVPCMMQYDYALPGVTAGVTKPDDLQINYPPLVLDEDGKETTTYDANSTPNRSDYLDDVKAGTLIIGEASGIRIWKGNILERVTRYVRAI